METNELENQNEQVNDQVNDQVAEQVNEQVNEEIVPQDSPWFSAYGYDSEDSFKNEFEQLKSYKTLAAELEERRKDVEAGMALLQDADDPFGGIEEAKTMVAFGKKGISSSIANQIVSSNPDSLMEDPLKALMLAEALKNPDKFKRLGQSTIEEAIREKYNLGEGEYYATALLKSDAIDAIEMIEKTKKDVETVKNPYTFAKELRSQTERQIAERQTIALNEAESYGKQLKDVPYKFGDTEVSLQVSNEEVESILKSQYAGYLGQAFDTTTKEGKQAVREWLKNQILIHKVQSGDLGVQIAKSLSAQTEKKVVKEVYNGQPKTVNRVGKNDADGGKLSFAQRDLLERNQPLPSQQLKNIGND
jgi:hypothetical protein